MTNGRILIRAGMAPYEKVSVARILTQNLLGNNNGNLVYQFSVFRILQTPGTKLVPNRYKVNPRDAKKINKKYDHLVLPFANTFKNKPSAIKEMKQYTKLIRKLNIPVTIIGIGLQAPLGYKKGDTFPFDDVVKDFISAVTEKRSVVGVRGRVTADYLSGLGFTEGKHHMIIGCPSMYTFGPQLDIRDTHITAESKVYVNSVPNSLVAKETNTMNFINQTMLENSNHYYVPTENAELKLTYTGEGNIPSTVDGYPTNKSNIMYQQGRIRFPVNVVTWLDMIRQADFVYGARLHGCIVATLAGVPNLMFTKDSRMEELADYHGLPAIHPGEVTENTTLEDLMYKVDFKETQRKQISNFDNFISFLEKNSLNHIFEDDKVASSPPLDKRLARTKLMKPIKPVSLISTKKVSKRKSMLKAEQEYIAKVADKKMHDRVYAKIREARNFIKSLLH